MITSILQSILVSIILALPGMEPFSLPSLDMQTEEVTFTVYENGGKQQDRDTLKDIDLRHSHTSNAVLSDNSSIYRICNSRPQRLQNTMGGKPERQPGRMLFHHRFKNLLKASPGSLWQTRMSRVLPDVSCDYYVIALRHILR